MNFAKLSEILVLCVLCISYLEHVSVLAESSEDLSKDSERTLSSVDDGDEADSRTLAGWYGYKKKYGGYGYRKKYGGYGYKKKYGGYKYHYGRKLAESSQDSERTLSSVDDGNEADSRTLAGWYGYKKKYGGYGYKKKYGGYGYKKKYGGYKYHYGRKLAESSQDSERTLSSVDDGDEADSRTLAGWYGYKKKYGGYGYKKKYGGYGYKKKYGGYKYKYKYGRKLASDDYVEPTCNCAPGYVKSHEDPKLTQQTDPDVCCQFCSSKGFYFSEYDVRANKCSCYYDGKIIYSNDDQFYACYFY